MLKCEICNTQPQTQFMTKCCKLFVCDCCKDKYEKAGSCFCGKNITNKKLCNPNMQLFEIVKSYYEGKPQQCDRCDNAAQIQCSDCNMLYCSQCNGEVHNGKGFAKHNRSQYSQELCSHRKLLQRAQRKEQWCKQHKLVYQAICECGSLLCGNCLKLHKQNCKQFTKAKTIKQHKQEYFSQILFKMKQITEYKQKLQIDKKQYQNHFNAQKDIYQTYLKLIDEQLQGLKKILQIKSLQTKNRLNEYWKQCNMAYKKTMYLIDYHFKKFDDLGRLSQKFVQKMIGYDYLQKRVKRFYVNQEFFNFRLQGFEDVQHAIINMSTSFKNWDISPQDKTPLAGDANEQKNTKDKKIDLSLANVCNANSQLLLECSKNPLNHRPLSLKASHNQIYFEFLHLPYQHEIYQIQYGVGLKMKGQQVFKKLQNKNGIGVIMNLNPSTKYRVRMRVGTGIFGPINEIKTQQLPKIITQISTLSKHNGDTQILKSGIVYGSNEINFGNHTWEIKILPTKHNDQETACISVGVSNKEQKKPIFVGTTLNYGYQKAMLTVKINLNCEQNKMTISSTGNPDQIYQNLPNFPIFPAIQNKGSNPVQIQCTFL